MGMPTGACRFSFYLIRPVSCISFVTLNMPNLHVTRSWAPLAILLCAAAKCYAASIPDYSTSPIRTERRTVAGGAELITFYQKAPLSAGESLDMPLVSVLKDTLDGSGEAERLRQVWVFTYSRPSFFRSLAGAVPFLYTRAPLPQRSVGKPDPVLDMAYPSRGAWKKGAAVILQTQVFDPISFAVRLVTRSYLGNLGEYRTMHLWQALDTLEAVGVTQGDVGLAPEEIAAIQARLQLSGQIFGAFVGDDYLERAHDRDRTLRLKNRAANWDLLRQKAEENGLYFPAGLDRGTARRLGTPLGSSRRRGGAAEFRSKPARDREPRWRPEAQVMDRV